MAAGYDPLSAQPGAPLPGPRHSVDDVMSVSPGTAGPASGPPDDAMYRPGGDTMYRPGPLPPVGSPVPSPGYSPAAFPAPAYPLSAPPMSALPAEPYGGPPPRARGRGRWTWPGLAALAMVVVLSAVAGWQAVQIRDLQGRVVDGEKQVADAQAADKTRIDSIEERTTDLETEAGKAFNPEAISSEVLPSVFRVSAGQFTGTAFAVGKQTGSTTNLFTNYHVVESVWEAGQREVFIERKDQRWPATIVKVDEEDDVAQLRTNNKFTGLTMATEAVKSGQQIVVIGAPLGLEDTVTTGVVSAIRKDEDGTGTVIQFDAPINPGNSGGPVINAAKQVVGIATAKARDAEGIGLAVPIKTACDDFKIC
ncbi:S1C family serine protease [Phytohabitans rumicis]|nr:S1C family serine protease [Phytohabitans rumicis]